MSMDKSAARWLSRLLRCRRLVAVVVAAAGAALVVVVAATTLIATASFWSPQSEIQAQLFFPGGEVQKERLSRIRSVCQELEEERRRKKSIFSLQREKQNKDALPLIVGSPPRSGRRVLYCHVPKAASSAWMRAMASMGGLEPEAMKDLHKEMLEQHSVNASSVLLGEEEEEEQRVIFVRHPFSRLASAYHDKFVQLRESSFYRPLVDFKRGALATAMDSKNDNKKVGISFKDFVDFVIHEIHSGQRSYGSLHWLPASKLCDPCGKGGSMFNFVGKVETLSEDVGSLRRKRPDLREHLRVFDKRWNSVHDKEEEKSEMKRESLTKRYFSQLSPSQISSLSKAFEADFRLFGYSPDEPL